MAEPYDAYSILKQAIILTAVVAVLVAAVAFLLGYGYFALSFLLNASCGILSMLLLVRDVQAAIYGNAKINQMKFIFRLACFAILLYLVLVRLQMNPFAVVFGLMLPIFAMLVVFWRIVRREKG
jgi:hypothetical protein